MQDDAIKAKQEAARLKAAFSLALGFAVLLWLIKLTEVLLDIHLAQYGVLPRQLSGLIGVLFAPLIHGSWQHLVANTLPVIILLTALLYGYPKAAKRALPVFYLGTGIIVWLFARQVYHIGASGLTFSLMFFISVLGVLRRDKQAIALALLVFFLYGGMLGGLVPNENNISYETHLAGFCLGVLLAFILRGADPLPPPKKYSWDYEAEEQAAALVDTEACLEDETETASGTNAQRYH